MSTVDVIVPCYNYARYLPRCLASVLDQPGVGLRILVIDDASSDETAAVAAAQAARDGRVEIRRHARNRGHIATYNEGLGWSTGDYTLLISADDYLAPGALTRAATLMDEHRDVGMVYGRQILFNDGEEPPQPGAEDASSILPGTELIKAMCATGHNPVATPTVLVRTALQKELGGYRADLPHTADMELWLRFAARAAVGIVGADQAYKRRHAWNMQHDYVATRLGDLCQRQAAFEAFFATCGPRLAGRERLERSAHQALAGEAFWAASEAFDRGAAGRCRELIALVTTLDPTLRERGEWRRWRWKQRLGPSVWRALQPVVSRWRGRLA